MQDTTPELFGAVAHADSAEAKIPLLGITPHMRAIWALADAGAIEATAQTASPRPSLIVRADALVSPTLLRELAPGEVVLDQHGAPVAGRLELATSESPEGALARGTPRPFSQDKTRYAIALAGTGRKAAKKMLLAGLTKPQDGPASKLLNRPVSTRVTALLVPFGVTPTMMTVVVALFGIAGGLFAASASALLQILGATLYQLHSILDGCDGEIARLTRNFSKHGALLDSVVDDVSNMLFFVGLSIGVHRALGVDWPLYCAAVTGLGYLAVTLIQFKSVLAATGKGFKATFWDTSRPRPLWYRVLHASLRRDVFIWICLGLVIVGLAPALVAVMPVATVATLGASLRRARQ
jgi:phosphatidylglycerophosphate synthase